MAHTNVLPDNLKKLQALEPYILAAFENISIGCIETELSFCNRPNITTDENGVDKYSIKHQVVIRAKSKDIEIEMDAILRFSEDCLLDKSDGRLAKIDIINGRHDLHLNHDIYEERHSYLTLNNKSAITLFDEFLGVKFTAGEQKQFGASLTSKESTKTKDFQVFCFILDLFNDILKNPVSSVGFKALKELETVNKTGIETALNDFHTLLNKTSF